MRNQLAVAVLAVLLCAGALYADDKPFDKAQVRPNILIILADDLGYQDLGCQGSTDIPTPHIDSIAKKGIRCTSGYVSSCMCSPSRAGLLTGRSQSRFGHEINFTSDPDGSRGLPLSETTFADRMKAAGYRTGAVGKWHLGANEPRHPMRRGFDEHFGFLGGGHRYFCDKYIPGLKQDNSAWEYCSLLERNGTPEETKGYLTEVLGRECAAFIHRNREQPWFLYAAFNAPHSPQEAPQKYLDRFPNITKEPRKTYCAMVSALDDTVGEILAQIRTDGLEERTLVVFLSDNGGPLDRNGSCNIPLSGEKGKMLEGGIRIPFLMQLKGRLPEGRIYDRPVSSLDLLPTALALAGVEAKPEWKLDGVNLIPFLTGERTGDPHERLLWRMKERSIWAIREGDEKLVMQKFEAPRLFNLAADIGESTNLAGKNKARYDELQRTYDAWAATLPEPLWGTGETQGLKAKKSGKSKK